MPGRHTLFLAKRLAEPIFAGLAYLRYNTINPDPSRVQDDIWAIWVNCPVELLGTRGSHGAGVYILKHAFVAVIILSGSSIARITACMGSSAKAGQCGYSCVLLYISYVPKGL